MSISIEGLVIELASIINSGIVRDLYDRPAKADIDDLETADALLELAEAASPDDVEVLSQWVLRLKNRVVDKLHIHLYKGGYQI
jgi:hypothetical protein